jgi:hypothetical protein
MEELSIIYIYYIYNIYKHVALPEKNLKGKVVAVMARKGYRGITLRGEEVKEIVTEIGEHLNNKSKMEAVTWNAMIVSAERNLRMESEEGPRAEAMWQQMEVARDEGSEIAPRELADPNEEEAKDNEAVRIPTLEMIAEAQNVN